LLFQLSILVQSHKCYHKTRSMELLMELKVLLMLPLIVADAEPGPVPNMSFSYQVRTHRTPAPSRLDVIKAPLLKYGPSWLSHPEIQHHCRLILLSSFFCTFGVGKLYNVCVFVLLLMSFLSSPLRLAHAVLLIVGVYILSAPPHPNFSAIFIVGGVIIFIPGSEILTANFGSSIGKVGLSATHFEKSQKTDKNRLKTG
uniref:PRA1 family protein n=1 Tax=Macrostomum lignano TaxID=282301 RepID=A0A1I8J1W1_9PLAT